MTQPTIKHGPGWVSLECAPDVVHHLTPSQARAFGDAVWNAGNEADTRATDPGGSDDTDRPPMPRVRELRFGSTAETVTRWFVAAADTEYGPFSSEERAAEYAVESALWGWDTYTREVTGDDAFNFRVRDVSRGMGGV